MVPSLKNLLMTMLLALMAGGCIEATTDPVALGELCAPATASCPALAALDRDAVGRNQLDYTLDLGEEPTGDQPAQIEVLVLVPSAAYDPTDPAAEIPDTDIVARVSHSLEAGGTVKNRFTPRQLGVRDELSLAIRCADCQARMLYVYANAPLECTEEGDCSGGWVCDTVFGRCVECLSEEECEPGQICDEERGRCDPPTSSGCATGGSSAPASLWLVALVLAAAAAARRRRRRSRVAPFLLVVSLAAIAPPASAAPPRGALSVGGGPRILTGPVGRDTERGVGLSIGQELRWIYVGLGVELSTAFYLTTQQPPPFSNTLQTYAFTLGPRGYLPLGGDLELSLGADYRRLGLAANSLVRQTGTETSFHAYGARGGLRYRWSAFELRLEAGYHPVVDLDGATFGVDAAIAITTGP